MVNIQDNVCRTIGPLVCKLVCKEAVVVFLCVCFVVVVFFGKKSHIFVKFICIISTMYANTSPSTFCIALPFVLRLNVPVNNFSIMSGRSHRFLGITSTFGG